MKSSAKKRFQLTKSNKIFAWGIGKRHKLTNKIHDKFSNSSQKGKRILSSSATNKIARYFFKKVK